MENKYFVLEKASLLEEKYIVTALSRKLKKPSITSPFTPTKESEKISVNTEINPPALERKRNLSEAHTEAVGIKTRRLNF